MVGKAKSALQKTRDFQAEKEGLIEKAIDIYRSASASESEKSLREVCEQVRAEHLQETGQDIAISHSTLDRRLKGGISKLKEASLYRAWLKPEETENVITYALGVAKRGFPLDHQRLKEHVDEVLRSRLGDDFPETGVGKNWTQRFIDRNRDRLGTYWSAHLDNKRGRAVNPNNHKAWFALLGETIEKYNISPDCTYCCDETGFMPGIGRKQRVIGPAGARIQYQQRDGNHETITVLVTICGDGTSIPPAVIFKGQAFLVKWKQNNPTNAILGHSRKGWITGEISSEWIDHFDSATKDKAAGRDRMLLVDGHSSHYDLNLLRKAREKKIHILCYMAHGTHVYQSLDVGIFGPLKTYWSVERDKWEREKHEKVSKVNFLAIFGKAYANAMKPELVKSAFQKTGVCPFNPNAISQDVMAPSLETSAKSVAPIVPPTPVRIVTKLLRQVSLTDDSNTEDSPTRVSLRHSPRTLNRAQRTHSELSATSVRYLTSDSPITSLQQIPTLNLAPLPPLQPIPQNLLRILPRTRNEIRLHAALKDSAQREAVQHGIILGVQSALVLQELYCNKTRGQLTAQEERRRNKVDNGKLASDGLPKLLTGDAFYERVLEHTRLQQQKANAQRKKKISTRMFCRSKERMETTRFSSLGSKPEA